LIRIVLSFILQSLSAGRTIINKKKIFMKEFMLLFKAPAAGSGLSPELAQAQMQKWYSWVGQLKTDGIYVDGRPLVKGGKSVSGKNRTVTDGPFAESKELIGGYFIVKAKDIDAALAITKDFPDYELGGSIEIREVQVM
jgi:hypothetical protein